ncbi:ABC transporter ATP-binding protein [Bradyrhizobium sp. AZCC 2230]|uniref:ABC transporter ATP-binding protein n=1 Tax=Bradyrhizobium sp. AZCC 2230 TaxID=3117021 RepID=UPI002FF0DAFB
MTVPKLEIVNLRKLFGDESLVAVDGIDFTVDGGETVALLGPSGCGKSTTLNMIVGLEQPTSGDIRIDGRSVIGVPPGKRNVGLVFQDYAVFTHMTVSENLAFGLAIRGRPKAEIARAVHDVAELLGMQNSLKLSAAELGGSELQRVAIGRTLVTKPAILLLDEPLSNLEASARLAMRRELRRLQSEIGLTIIYVTHDQIEALSLADRIAVMNAGKLQQIERTSVICRKPDHVFVAGFMGSPPMNLLRGEIIGDGTSLGFGRDGLFIRLSSNEAFVTDCVGQPIILGLRPESLTLAGANDATICGKVAVVEPRGPEAVVTVEVGTVSLKAVVPTAERPQEGADIGLLADPSSFVFFSGETGRRLAS